jgi:hypothetical protein
MPLRTILDKAQPAIAARVELICLASSASKRITSFAVAAKRTTARAESLPSMPVVIYFIFANVLDLRTTACSYHIIEIYYRDNWSFSPDPPPRSAV